MKNRAENLIWGQQNSTDRLIQQSFNASNQSLKMLLIQKRAEIETKIIGYVKFKYDMYNYVAGIRKIEKHKLPQQNFISKTIKNKADKKKMHIR